MQLLITIVSFLFVMGVIVFVHELGHFIAAKKFGVYCGEFAIGMGPIIFAYQGKETKYTLRLLPIGGFVAMAGEDETEVDIAFHRTINGIKTYQKIIVLLAGIFMNIVLAFVIYLGVFTVQGSARIDGPINVVEVQPNTNASKLGLQANDKIQSINLKNKTVEVTNFNDAATVLLIDDVISINVLRNNEVVSLPYFKLEDQTKILDGSILTPNIKKISLLEVPKFAFNKVVADSSTIFKTLGKLIRGIGVKHISGPVGIFNVIGNTAQVGILPLFALLALLSINIGLFNLLPIPALDGGRVLLTIIEKLLGKHYNKKIEYFVITISFILLFALILLITFNDIIKLF